MKLIGLLILFVTIQLDYALAMRPSHKKEILLKYGFHKVIQTKKSLTSKNINSINYIERSLPWPIELKNPPYQFISNMQQYQTFTSPAYYHAGLDILSEKDQKVYATSSGILTGGYYSYSDEIDGTTTKYFLPYKKALEEEIEIPWGKFYFELSIRDDFGNTFEYHHIDVDNLPVSILEKIFDSNLRVSKGELLGTVFDLKDKKGIIELRHIHYNILNSNGIYLNPFYFSQPIIDNLPPNIYRIYGTKNGRCYLAPILVPFYDEPIETSEEIIIQTLDLINKNGLSKAPEKIIVKFGDEIIIRDFSQSIADFVTGKRPHIQHIYLPTQCTESASEISATRTHNFYFRFPIPLGFKGEVEVTVYDQNNNFSKAKIKIKNTIKREYKIP